MIEIRNLTPLNTLPLSSSQHNHDNRQSQTMVKSTENHLLRLFTGVILRVVAVVLILIGV